MTRIPHYKTFTISLFILLSSTSYSQYDYDVSAEKKLLKGVTESLSLIDLPVYLTFLFREDLKTSIFADKIDIPPFRGEHLLVSASTMDRTSSIGSINKDLIPLVFLGGGFLATLSLDLFSSKRISSYDYKRIFVFYKSLLYTYTFTEVAKTVIKRRRPNQGDYRSFFSGHSSTTFAAMHFLNKEFQSLIDEAAISDRSTRIFVKAATFTLLYGWAGVVAYSRVNDNQHYLSDVLIGGVVGILFSEIIHRTFMTKSENFNLVFTPNRVGFNLSF